MSSDRRLIVAAAAAALVGVAAVVIARRRRRRAVLARSDLERLRRDGYLVIPILSPEELQAAREEARELGAAELADPHATGVDLLVRKSVHPHDAGLDYAEGMCRKELWSSPALQEAIVKMVEPARCALGFLQPGSDECEVVLNTSTMLVAPKGYLYRQGYHRDLIAVPEAHVHEIEPMLTESYFHNDLQFNLSLYDDYAFWAVPGSHRRGYTPAEAAAFDHRPLNIAAPLEAELDGAVNIFVPGGSVMMCCNNLIHRGYCGGPQGLLSDRLTLHGAFHSTSFPPSLHFDPSASATPANTKEEIQKARAEKPRVTPAYQQLLDARVERTKSCPNSIPHLGELSNHSSIYHDKLAGKLKWG